MAVVCCAEPSQGPPMSPRTSIPIRAAVPREMVWIAGGRFIMGSDKHYEEERPARDVQVDGFWIDRTPVTNAQFAAFVEDTGWKTLAELPPDPSQYPGALPGMLVPGALVFRRSKGPVDLTNIHNWWAYVPGADWRHPRGPRSGIDGLDDHPVVQVAWSDVEAYARWAGVALPTETEWEYAARGGLDGAEYAWGADFMPDGRHMANTWQGRFPWENLAEDGFDGTSPVRAFAPNGYGLHDMIGNVWEWTQDWWGTPSTAKPAHSCCASRAEEDRRRTESLDALQLELGIPRKVLKGGSHLCAPSYCRRYRPAARHAEPVDTSTSHVGFRCILRPGAGGEADGAGKIVPLHRTP